jgi:membrane fusion protein (multidrug efflux system)
MNKRSFTIVVIVVIVLVALIYLKPKSKNGAEAQKKNSAASSAVVAIDVIHPVQMNNTIQVAGSVMANEEVDLKPETNGKIEKLFIQEGATIKKGDLLLKIKDADLQAMLEKQNYQIRLSKENESRQKRLLEIQAISQQEYDVAMNQLNTLKADAEVLKVQISKTEIRAPFDGVIGLKYVSEGSFVSGTSRIATIQDMDPLKIDFSLPEQYIHSIHIHDSILFTVPGSDKEFAGLVYAIEPKIDPATRTVQVRAVYPNKQHLVFPGSFASVRLIMQKIQNAILIPTQAVIPTLKGNKVFICKNGKAVPQNIEISTRTEDKIRVTKGLAPGDSLIVTGIMQLKIDMPVKVLKQKAKKMSLSQKK